MKDNHSEARDLPNRPDLSVVSTMYKSADFIDQFHRRITDAAARLDEFL